MPVCPAALIARSGRIADSDERLDALQQLETELGDLLTRPLDEITADDLDEMLTRYSNIIDGATREALKQVLAPHPPTPSPTPHCFAMLRGEGEPERVFVAVPHQKIGPAPYEIMLDAVAIAPFQTTTGG